MLIQLSRYFVQFQKVYVPQLGTLRLVQQPAQLNRSSKTVQPPQFEITFSEGGHLSTHQVEYFAYALQVPNVEVHDRLAAVGRQLFQQLNEGAFTWQGIGTFSKAHAGISFEAQPSLEPLQSLTAEPVLREGAAHAVRIGDKMVLSSGTAAAPPPKEHTRQWSKIVAWAFIILALFFIIFYLYQSHFSALATGLRQHVDAPTPGPTHVP